MDALKQKTDTQIGCEFAKDVMVRAQRARAPSTLCVGSQTMLQRW